MSDFDPVKGAIDQQTRRARRGIEKMCPDQLALFDALVKNGAGEILRAAYQIGMSDGIRTTAGFSFSELDESRRKRTK